MQKQIEYKIYTRLKVFMFEIAEKTHLNVKRLDLESRLMKKRNGNKTRRILLRRHPQFVLCVLFSDTVLIDLLDYAFRFQSIDDSPIIIPVKMCCQRTAHEQN